MSELKRCPFCGGEAIVNIFLGNYCVTCENCMGAIFPARGMTEEEAIKAWNSRKPMERIAERLEEENTLTKKQRKEAIEYDDEQMIFATNNQIRAFDYSLRVIREEGGMNEKVQ